MKKPVEPDGAGVRPLACAICAVKECYRQGLDCFRGLGNPTSVLDEEDRKVLECAAAVESTTYCQATRIEELLDFSARMGYRRLGIAFCIGLAEEARALHQILAGRFAVFSVCCKVCGMDKEKMGLPQIRENSRETMCNPVGQALLLASENTQLNIIVGLCLGHDILFTRHSQAPVTTLIVKDRVLAHNPAGALYSGYYKKTKFGLQEKSAGEIKPGK